MGKFWLRSLAAVLLAIPAGAQLLPFTQSGPFLRHRVTVANLEQGCTLQMNGQTVARQGVVDFDTRTLSIQTRMSCARSATTGNNWSHEWTGTVTVGTPADLPPGTRETGFHIFVGAPMPTTATASFTFTPGASPSTTYTANVELYHGFARGGTTPPPGAQFSTCAYQKSERTNQPKTAFSMSTAVSCDNLGAGIASVGAHGFGAPGNTNGASYQGRVYLFAQGLAPGADFSRLELQIETVYATSGPIATANPSTLRLTAALGQTTPVTGTIEIRNSGGGLLDVRTATSGFLSMPVANAGSPAYSVSPTRATDIGPNQTRSFSITMDPTAARLRGTYFANHAFVSDVTGSAAPRLELVVGDQVDTISLTNVSPPSGSGLAQGNQITLTAAVNVVSAASGSVIAELRDPSGTLVGSATSGSIPAGSSNVPLTLTVGTIPPTATKLTLKAILRTAITNTESAPIDYTIGVSCPARAPVPKEPRVGEPREAGECDFIRMDIALPFPVDPILATADFLPAFCGSGTFAYSGTRRVEVVLVLIRSGDVLAVSPPQQVVNQATRWGGDCFRAPLSLIRESEMPAFDIPAGTPFDRPVGGLRLEARLREVDGGPTLATSNPAFYTVIPGVSFSPKLMVAYRGLVDGEAEWRDGLAHSGGDFSRALADVIVPGDPSFREAFLQGELKFAGQGATLDADFATLDAAGSRLPNKLKLTGILSVQKGTNEFKARTNWIQGAIPEGTILTQITPQLRLVNGQVVSFAPLSVASDAIQIASVTPVPDRCSLNQPSDCLVKGASNHIKVNLAAFTPASGFELRRLVSIDPGSSNDGLVRTLPAASTQVLTDEFDVSIPDDPHYVYVSYQLVRTGADCAGRCARVDLEYNGFISGLTQIAANAANLGIAMGNGALTAIRNNSVARPVRSAVATVGLVNKLGNTVKDFGKYFAVQNTSFLAIPTTWSFDPPIPRDGTFSAHLTLKYSADSLPRDEPNFAESRLQIVSVDANGALRSYPTTLNTTAKTAEADIDSLDPAYSLAVLPPFAQSGVFLTNPASGFVQVNTGATDANLILTPYTATGTGSTTRPLLRGNNSVRTAASPDAQGPSWVQSWTTVPAVEGVTWTDQGALFEVTPASAPGVLFLFPAVEYAARKATELRVANVSWASAAVKVRLYNPNGTERGVYSSNVAPKASFTGKLEGLFPALPKGFTGYAVISATQNVVVSGVYSTPKAATSLAGIPMTDASLNPVSKFALRAGEAGAAGVLRLVNLATTAARLTLRARTAAGASAGNPVTVDLPAQQQYNRALADIFNVAADTIASVQVDGAAGVAGDLLTMDSAFVPAYHVSLALVSEARSASVLPFLTQDSTVYVYNPNSATATVTVTPTAADGSRSAGATESVPGFGRASIGASGTAAYLNITASQPVLAAAWLTNTSGSITGYPAVPSATALPLGQPGARPSATAAGVLNAASFQGGPVAPGEIVTLFGSNLGPPSLASLALAPDGRVSNFIGSTRVFFDGVPAPFVYALAGQTSVIVPYSVAGRSTTQMVVEYQGRRGDPVTLNVATAAPGLFSANSSGTGQGAILNQNSSINSLSNPADKGSAVVLFGTGEGTGDPDVADGNVNATVFPKPRQSVTVTIGGIPAQVLYAGAAPGFVAGVLQVNAVVPANAPSGNVPVVVTVGGIASQSGFTVAVAGPVTAAPLIAVSPTTLDFGSVTPGQTRDLTLTVRNLGAANLSVNSLTSSSARYTVVSPAAPFTVSPNGTQTVTLRFSPNATGVQTGTLTIASNDAAQASVAVALTGSGSAAAVPSIDVTPATLDFGSITLGQSRDLILTLRNTGSANLIVSSVTSSNPRFTLVSPSAPITVAAAGSVSLNIRFSPNATGSQSGTLTLASNDATRPSVQVALNGTGAGAATAPSIDVTPAALEFGSVAVLQSRDLVLTVRNTGTAPLTVSTATSSNIRFTVVSGLAPFTVPAGGTQAMTVRFTPAAAGVQLGSLTLISNDTVRPSVAVPLSATGTSGSTGTTPITIGQTIIGTLTTSSPRSVTCAECYAVTYRITVPTAQQLDVRLLSTAFDAYLVLISPAGVVLAEDDDSGGGTNARLAGSFTAGDYLIEVTSAFFGETGPFTLSVAPLP